MRLRDAQLRVTEEGFALNTVTHTSKFADVADHVQVRYDAILKTNGGYMLDVAVTLDNRTTTHRVVVGEWGCLVGIAW